VIVDVPVVFPSSKNYALTFPIEQGDEVLLVFSQRSLDNWFARGGPQEQSDRRYHHPADAIAVVGLRSQPNVIPNFDQDHAQLRSADGQTVITLDDNGVVTVKADNIKLDGDVEITGRLTGDQGADFHDDVNAGTISLQHHLHSGVSTGKFETGPPVP
jgi:hypothetical protein